MSDLTSSTSTTSEDYVRESDSGDTDSDTTIDFPLEKLTLSWRNITYEVQTSGLFSRTKETRTLLNQVSGHAKPGELVALMGPSGAGKSTLLDVLARRIKSGLSGDILVNGTKPNRHSLKRSTAYVPQDDALHGELTVRENIWFSAMLRLPFSMPRSLKEARVQEVIEELGLTKAADTKIGNQVIRGVSGGEKKRASIGMELVTGPSLLFLDEPTSGLDSKSTRLLVELLKELARKHNKTIIATIHQPSSYIISLFDRVALLSRGDPVFFGSVPDGVKFFEKNGYKLPPSTNPADFFIETINRDFNTVKEEKQEDLSLLVNAFHESKYKKAVISDIDTEIKNSQLSSDSEWQDKRGAYHTSRFVQTFFLMWRALLCYARNPTVFGVRFFIYVTMAICTGTLFLSLPYEQSSIIDRLAGLGFVPVFLMYISMTSLSAFIEDRVVFLRERMNGYYSVAPYAIATSVIMNIFVMLSSVVVTCVFYFLMGLNPDSNSFGTYMLILMSSLLCAEGIVSVVSTFVPNAEAGMSLISGLFGILMLTNGFFIRAENIPGWWIWVHYLSFQKYTFEAAMTNEFMGDSAVFPCMVYNISLLNDTSSSFCACNYPDLNRDCITQGTEILAELGYLEVNKWQWIGVMFSMSIIWRLIYYGMLRWWVSGKR